MDFQTPEEASLMFLLFISMILAAAFIACSAEAYIPSSQFVFNRLAAQHGKGTYLIEDEVTVHEGTETAVIHENWVVVDGGEMRLQAQGDGTHVFRIMKKGRQYWVDDTGAERSAEIPQGHVMRNIMMRTPNEEKRVFVNWGVLPPDVFRDKKLPKDVKDIKVESDPFVRLGRVGGAVTLAYGKPSPNEGQPAPGLWIEQDQFNIRKMRGPDGAEVYLNDYGAYSKGLVFPKTQIINFDNHMATVRVLKVSSIVLSGELKSQFDLNWLRGRPDTRSAWPQSTLGPVIQDFYRRFR